MEGRSGILGDLKDHTFIDAVSGTATDGTNYVYFITSSGLLCLFTKGRVLDKWIDLQVDKAFAVDVNDKFVVCACSNGVVR